MASPEQLVRKPSTIGLPFPGVEVRFLDDAGNEVADGQRGELYVGSDQFNFGYYKNEEATKKASRGRFRTVGDIGYRDEEGLLFVVDRKSDMIISGGVNIYPAEIEAELLTHPSVADAAVIGMPDSEWGESVCAFVVARPGETLSAEEVIRFCGERLASLKKPKRVELIAELPRSPQGKVQKRELRAKIG
jgi:acyl-CoA synthetase (AMP-forming)/AMP-acid ligase II